MAAASLFFGSTTVASPACAAVSELKAAPSSPICCSARSAPVHVSCKAPAEERVSHGRRQAFTRLAAALLLGAAATSAGNAKAGLVEDLLAKSAANKELNDRKRLATSGANTARAYTVAFGTCKFPENFTGCQDLARKKNVPFLSEDLKLECEGKEKYKCGSNVFWKW